MQPQTKLAVPLHASSTTAAATATGTIDTLGYDFVSLAVIAGTADVVSNKPTVLKIQEADVTNATSFTDISGLIGGTDFTIPNAVTAATTVPGNQYMFNVDTKGRKRYLRAVISPATTQLISMVANLSKGSEAPVSAAKANVLALIEI